MKRPRPNRGLVNYPAAPDGLTISFDTFDNGNEAPAIDLKVGSRLIARKWFSGGASNRDVMTDEASTRSN